jgi:rod shape-determining protein MreC
LQDTRRTRAVFVVLVIAALALMATDYLGGSGSLRAFGGTVFGPAERGVRSVTRPVTGFLAAGTGSGGPAGRVQALERQLVRLRAQLNDERLSRRDYAQLARLLRLPRTGRDQIVGANVIGVGQEFQRAVTLDVGSRDGVRPAETVLNASGLVGTVTSVSPWTCTVLLATDPAAVAGVRLTGSRKLGWVTGTATSRGGGLLTLHVLGAASAVTPGQRLVTTASVGNRPYVAGVPVGVVTGVATGSGLPKTALVRPFADFSSLDVVAVVVGPSRHGGHRKAGQPDSRTAGG